MQKHVLYTSGVIFAMIALAHLVRLILDLEIVVGGVIVPFGLSGVATLLAGGLAVWTVAVAVRS